MARSREQADKAFAGERTILAWNRSGLAAVVCIAVLLRHTWPLRGTGQDVAMGLIAAAAIAWAGGFLASTASNAVNGQQELPIDGHEISPLADTRTPRRRTGFLPSGRSSDQRLHPLPGESLF